MPSSDNDRLKLIIESILFVADEPVEIAAFARISGHNEGAVLDAVDAIAADFQGRGLRIQRAAGAVQMVTAPEAAPFVEQFLGVDEDHRISHAAIETLAIIAYNQPLRRTPTAATRRATSERAP